MTEEITTTCIRIPENILNEVKHICVDERINQSTWINQAIKMKLETYKKGE